MRARLSDWTASPALAATCAVRTWTTPRRRLHPRSGRRARQLTLAKSGRGGAECIIRGFASLGCLDKVPLGDLMNGRGAPALLEDLPDEDLAEGSPEVAAEELGRTRR